MTHEQPLDARIVDLDSIADTLSTTLGSHPGVIRLEPTMRSAMTRWKVASVEHLHRNLRHGTPSPTVAIRDGLVLSFTDNVLTLDMDLATSISSPALGLARETQEVAAEVIRASGLSVGHINVTILAIEGAPAS
ncbi:hypothetical protein [Arthrobacter pityocampae]|uniref:hypothetical protein n=1 Tax=Arthrobacter pityocampae TaxID=547334 RepID=UPI00373612BC